MDKIYIECEGRKSGDQLIECFPDVIKSILIDEVGLQTGYLEEICFDQDSFNKAGNQLNGTRKDWKCAASIDKRYSLDLIADLARNSALIVMPDYLNNEKIITLDIKETEKIITYNDILADKGGNPEVLIYKTDVENIFNSFIIKYFCNYNGKDYLKAEFINKDCSSLTIAENQRPGNPNTFTGLCFNSYNRYKKKAEYIIESEFIRDRGTAIRLLKWYTEWLTRRRLIIETLLVINANTIDLEVGDQVKINIDLLQEGIRNQHNFIITETESDYIFDKIFVRLWQMHYPL